MAELKIKICKICGKEFTPLSNRRTICYDTHYHKCPVCGKRVISTDLQHLDTCCSKECSVKKRLNTMNVSHSENKNTIQLCSNCGRPFASADGRNKVCNDCKSGTCEICGKVFQRTWPYTQSTCSEDCRIIKMRKSALSTKTCELCGKEFTPTSPRQKYCKGPHYRTCVVCGKQFEFSEFIHNPTRTCSQECENKLRKSNMLEKYGVDNPMKVDEFKSHMAATNVRRYGSPWYLTSNDFKNKFKQSMLKKYGVEWPMQNKQIRRKITTTMSERYGVPWYVLSEEYSKLQSDSLVSTINRQFGHRLEAAGISYKYEFRIENRSYDIKLINHNILIEMNPSYTHNVIGNHWTDEGIDPNYHQNKSIIAMRNGFFCYHIFDWDDWDSIIELLPLDTGKVVNNYRISSSSDENTAKIDAIDESDDGAIASLFISDNTITDYETDRNVQCSNILMELIEYSTKNNFAEKMIIDLSKPRFLKELWKISKSQVIRSPSLILSKGKSAILADLSEDISAYVEDHWLPVYDCGSIILKF